MRGVNTSRSDWEMQIYKKELEMNRNVSGNATVGRPGELCYENGKTAVPRGTCSDHATVKLDVMTLTIHSLHTVQLRGVIGFA